MMSKGFLYVTQPKTEEEKQKAIKEALEYAREKNLERDAVADERAMRRNTSRSSQRLRAY
jgi:hypothetical protein